MGQVGKMKSKTATVEMNCGFVEADGIQDRVGCDFKIGLQAVVFGKTNLVQMLNLEKKTTLYCTE